MVRTEKNYDYIFLTIIGLLIANTIFRYIQNNFALSINNYLGFVSWFGVILIRGFSSKVKIYGVWVLLILSSVNILNFTIETTKATFGIGDEGFHSFAINPVCFFLLISYCVLKRKSLLKVTSKILLDTEQEREEKQKRKVDFYYRKFNACEAEELNGIYKSLKEYPEEAQIALNMIKRQKEKGR